MAQLDRRALLTLMGLGATAACSSVALTDPGETTGALAQQDGTPTAQLVGHGADLIPMNAANLTPMFVSVEQAFDEFERQLRRDVSFPARAEFVSTHVEGARQKTAAMLGVRDPADIAFVRNTSEGNSTVINGMILSAGDEIVVWSENHATNKTSWRYRSEVTPIVVNEVYLPSGELTASDVIEAFASALTEKTKVLSLSHISNISGRRLPLKEIIAAARAKSPNLHVHIDGAQSWGSVKVDLGEMDCDSYAASAHKYLLGPRGAGILYVRRNAVSRVRPVTLGYNLYFTYPESGLAETAERFECHGQRDLGTFAAIGSAVDAHEHFGGPRAVETAISKIVDYAKSQLAQAGISVATPNEPGASHGVIVMNLGGPALAMAGFLMLHQSKIGAAFVEGAKSAPDAQAPIYLRLSPHIFNTTAHVDVAIPVIEAAQAMPISAARALVDQYL